MTFFFKCESLDEMSKDTNNYSSYNQGISKMLFELLSKTLLILEITFLYYLQNFFCLILSGTFEMHPQDIC